MAIIDRLPQSAQLPLLVALLVLVLAVEFWQPIWESIRWIAVRGARSSVTFAGRHKRLGMYATGWAGLSYSLALLGPVSDPVWSLGLVALGQVLVLFSILTFVATAETHVAALLQHRRAQRLEEQFRSAHIPGVKPPPARVGPFDELTGAYVPTRTDLVAMNAPLLAAIWLAFH